MADLDPLIRAFPLLHALRQVDSWWRLAALLERVPLDPAEAARALDALIALDRSWGDDPSAASHASLREALIRALEVGVEVAFGERSRQVLADLPRRLAGPLGEVDDRVLEYLRGGDSSVLEAAETAWIRLAGSIDLDALALPLRLSLICDACALHGERVAVAHSAESQEYHVRLLRAARALFADFEAHPPHCRLHLNPRVQSLTASLAVALRTSYALDGDEEALATATGLHSALLQVTHPSSPDFPLRLAEYGQTLGYRGPEGVADGAVALGEAAALEPVGSRSRVRSLTLAGRGWLSRFADGGEPEDLSRALGSLEAAVAEATGGDAPVFELVEGLLLRAVVRGSREDLGSALDRLRRRADPGEPAESADQPSGVRILAALKPILPHPEAGGVVEAGLAAVAAFTETAEEGLVAEEAASLAVLLQKFDAGRTSRLVLDRSIGLLETSCELDAGDGLRAADRHGNLAVLLERRFALAGENRDLGRGLVAARTALAMSTEGGRVIEAGRSHANTLGGLLLRRYEILGGVTDLHEAVAVLDTAVPECEEARRDMDPEQLSGFLGNFGSALRARAELRRSREDLDRAVELLEQAAEISRRVAAKVRVGALNNLAAARYSRFRVFDSQRDLDVAIDEWSEALEGADQDGVGLLRFNLGSARLSRYERDGDRLDLDEAVTLLKASVPVLDRTGPDRPLAANRLAAALHRRGIADDEPVDLMKASEWSRAAAAAAQGFSETWFRVTWDWGGRAVERSNWAEAAEAYEASLEALQALFDANLLPADRETWLEEAFGLPTRAAWAMAQAGEPRRAVVALEHGRGLILADALGVPEARLQASVGPEHAPMLNRYRAARARWRLLGHRVRSPEPGSGPPTFLDVESARRELLESRRPLTVAPETAGAFGRPEFEEIHRGATPPLVYLVPGLRDGTAIVVDGSQAEPQLVQLPGLDEASLGRETRAFVAAYQRITENPAAWPAELDRVTRWLGRIFHPLLDALAGRRSVWIPTGALPFLPLAAAWVTDGDRPNGRRHALDDVLISFAPTALSLAAARERSSYRRSASSFLGVSDPRPSAHPALSRAAGETTIAGSTFADRTLLDGPAATARDVSRALARHHVLHFACHAHSLMDRPWLSGVFLAYDRRLTVADFVEMDLSNAKLAVLSACETGVPGHRAPDEVIGIGTALFQAGVDGVVVSLWPVLDASALILITRFYECWRGVDGEAQDPATALIRAQQWTRDTTNGEKRGHWDRLRRNELLSGDAHAGLVAELEHLEPDARDFAGLDHWAAFIFVGAS